MLVGANSRGAQQFIYNSWGQVAEVNDYLNKTDANLYDARATLSNTPNHANWRVNTQFEYDAVGRVTENRDYYHANASLYIPFEGRQGEPDWAVTVFYGGAIKQSTTTKYNQAGEVVRVEQKKVEVDLRRKLEEAIPNKYEGISRTIYASSPWTASSLRTQSISQDYKYKVAGRVDSYAYYQKSDLPNGVNQLVHRFNEQYEGRDTYLDSVTFGSGDNSHKDSQHLQDAQTRSSYDANGNRTRIEEHITDSRYTGDKNVNARYMRFDAEGKLLSKVTGEQRRLLTNADLVTKRTSYNPMTGQPVDWESTVARNVGFTEDTDYAGRGMGSYHLYSGSNYLGEINKSGSNSIKEQHFKAPGANDASIMARHQVQSGDTLKGIAKLYYGSEDLWYVIADVNGLGAGSELLEGVMLDIPARANNFNSHDNFKPMNLGEIVGNTDPSLLYIPPPPEAGCNAVASIVMIAVAVVATIATAGAAAAAMGGVAGATTTMGAGMAVLGGAAVGTGAAAGALGVAAAAIGGFVGSVASQVVGKAMGAVDSFSLKGALASGLTAGATAGMGQYLQGADWANNGKKSIDAVTGLKTLKTAGKTVMGATSAISSVAANKLVGNQASFCWGNVAASAVTSAVAPGDYGAIGKGIINPINGIIQSGIQYGADKLFGNQASWNFGNVATDAFGNALGNSIVSGIQRSETEKNNRNRYIEAMGQKLTADTARKIDGQLATNLNNSLNTTMQGLDASVDRMLWAINRNNAIDAQASFASEDASNLARRNRVVTSTNAYSDLIQANIQSVSYQHELNKYNRALNTLVYGEQINARYQRGNQMVADEFSKFQPIQNDLFAGVDVEGNIAWGQQRREAFNQSFIGVASNAGKMIKENGGFVVAYGGTGGASTGAGADAALGRFLAVDLNNWSLTTGNYRSTEVAANFGIPVPEAHVGVELSLYMTPKYQKALQGDYGIAGGAASLGLQTIDIGVVRTKGGEHHGLQITYTRDFDATKILPKFSNGNGYIKGGSGDVFNVHKWW
ncbi:MULTISPECIES: LysM peptidoglycan-binding domain-containing protein [unclassified Pseudoalteromonas]|uniref:LysM peptidoglycan-binding domain-containing protein n=1 Tax=unclassified Pseudoalteromonas TaxID=194690 RepID=UPI00390C8A18|nr:LysM domain-containing protein [Ningiella sp. W23]